MLFCGMAKKCDEYGYRIDESGWRVPERYFQWWGPGNGFLVFTRDYDRDDLDTFALWGFRVLFTALGVLLAVLTVVAALGSYHALTGRPW
jgi:hypothetical protein